MPSNGDGDTTAPKTAKKKTAAKKKTTAKKAVKKKKTAKKTVAKKTTKRTKAAPASGQRLRVKQVRSTIGRRHDFRQTLEALGIRHHQDEVVVTQSPSIDGMLRKVRHLVRVTPEG